MLISSAEERWDLQVLVTRTTLELIWMAQIMYIVGNFTCTVFIPLATQGAY